MKPLINRFKIATVTTALAFLIIIIPLILRQSAIVILISNFYFLVGLFVLVVASFIMILSGHLFTGWRRYRRKGDDADEEKKRIPAKEVGRLKNAPIRVSKKAQYCLQVAIPLIIISVLSTL
ncbi:DUF3899 domain-containing protein [Lactobacillaceae bacterium Scapto_B20]